MSLSSLRLQAINRLVGPAAAMLAASILLGLTYNAASPLGVRSTMPAGAAASVAPFPNTPANVGNETISMSLLPPTTAQASGKVYQNETLSLSLNSPQTGAAAVRPGANSLATPSVGASPPLARRPIPSLTWPEVKLLLAASQIVLVDARLAAHYEAGHIPGAVSLTAHSPPNEMSAFAAKYPKQKPLVAYCGSESCPMAHALAEALISEYGFANVRVMPGGYAEYRLAEARTGTPGAVK